MLRFVGLPKKEEQNNMAFHLQQILTVLMSAEQVRKTDFWYQNQLLGKNLILLVAKSLAFQNK